MTSTRSVRIRTVALLGGGVVAGVIGALALGANAQSTTAGSVTSTTPSASSASVSPAKNDPAKQDHGTETEVTGSKATTLKANALKQVPGATVDRISTADASDPSGAAYEVHLTKTDGTRQTLLFVDDLHYLSTEAGGGPGGRGPGHGGGGAGEKAGTGTDGATLRAAALKQVPGATVDEVTTDSGDAAYEVHLTKADGTDATVKFDTDLKFVAVESGRGK